MCYFVLDSSIGMWAKLSVAGFLVFIASCDGRPEASTPEKTPVRVEVFQSEPETFQETIVASAVAEAKVEYRVSTQVMGMLKVQHMERGDRVEKGVILFEIDPEEFELRVRERRANLHRAQAQLTFMKEEKARKEPLYKNGTLSRSAWDRVLLDVALAESEKEQTHVALERAERDLRLTSIRSPITGRVLERYHETGEVIPSGTVLYWIVDTAQIVFEVGLSDRELSLVKQGESVEVRVDAFPDSLFQGTIAQISGNADPGTGTFPVEVMVSNRDLKILPGMVGRVALPGRIHRDRIIVPLLVVQQRLDGAVVYVVENNRAMTRRVTLGRVLGHRVVVLEGIVAGEHVVQVGQGRLDDGDPVDVVE